ncbi:hypothetical protein NDU88_002623 [Pleurodeles waltl]|uniref:Uncharacterized protein n=1 Tax=Pleurodeles waltl TaxID=8319 RepID=A0AAV7WLR5_PLEWA|nr:hypothetical protein NDU88_002623 [Pleurodeles waltl]
MPGSGTRESKHPWTEVDCEALMCRMDAMDEGLANSSIVAHSVAYGKLVRHPSRGSRYLGTTHSDSPERPRFERMLHVRERLDIPVKAATVLSVGCMDARSCLYD